jgi:hypothetical protein
MKPTPAPTGDDLWLSRAQTATLLGVSVSQLANVVLGRLGKDDRRKDGRAELIRTRAAVKAFVEFKTATAPLDGPDDFNDGEASPNLERWRLARAKMAELDLHLREGRLIDVELLSDRLRGLLDLLKGFGGTLQREFGRNAAVLYNEFLDDVRGLSAKSDGFIPSPDEPEPTRPKTLSTNGVHP